MSSLFRGTDRKWTTRESNERVIAYGRQKKKEHMGAGKVEKERGKKKTETVVGRTIARTLDWMDFWWNFRAVLSLGAARLSLCLYSMLHCFRKYLFSLRFLADNTDATPCFMFLCRRKQRRLEPRDEGITIRDFHYFVPFVPSFVSKNNLANAFWETRWIRCCWSLKNTKNTSKNAK